MGEINQITGKLGLTLEYLFDDTYAEHRSRRILFANANKNLSVLAFLLRNLSDAERELLFPGQFDMSNSHHPQKLTTEALISEIRAESRGEAAESIRIIKEGIKDLTGIHFKTFFNLDKWGTLKVVKLLYTMRSKNPVRIFSLLAPPSVKVKYSMEVKDAHPLDGNERAVYLISDLKALLSLEIEPARLNEIDEAFGPLLDIINGLAEQLIQSAISASGGNYNILIRQMDMLLKQLSILESEEVSKQITPLAETLYFHCSAMEFTHLTKATSFITSCLMPNSSTVVAIGTELRQLVQSIQGRCQASTNDKCIRVFDFNGFVSRHGESIFAALTTAMGGKIAHKDIEKATPYAEKLIRLWAVFKHPQGILTVTEDFEVSPLVALAALAAICYEFEQPTKYRPYWLGQKFARGNVLSALERIDIASLVTKVPEEYNTFWLLRLTWFQYALAGQLDLLERQQQLMESLITSFEHRVQSYDTTAIMKHVVGCTWLCDHLRMQFCDF